MDPEQLCRIMPDARSLLQVKIRKVDEADDISPGWSATWSTRAATSSSITRFPPASTFDGDSEAPEARKSLFLADGTRGLTAIPRHAAPAHTWILAANAPTMGSLDKISRQRNEAVADA